MDPSMDHAPVNTCPAERGIVSRGPPDPVNNVPSGDLCAIAKVSQALPKTDSP
jgi:hypothetical protein